MQKLDHNKCLLITGPVSSTTFDLTLMICLIRHLTPIQIGDIVPHSTDVSAGADLSRLKYYRNKFAHHDGCKLTERDFEIYWSEIFQVTKCVIQLFKNGQT